MNDELTAVDIQKMQEELEYLKTVRRKELAEEIKQNGSKTNEPMRLKMYGQKKEI